MTFDLRARIEREGFAMEERGWALLQMHFDQLLKWNGRTNLTAIRDPEAIAERHFLESLYLARAAKLSGHVYDIGSGPGFPGLPLKAAFPEIRLTLVESVGKKVAFLKEVVRCAGAVGVQVEQVRLEDLAKRQGIDADWVTMRAVKPDRLLQHFRRLLSPHGKLALFLGSDDASRISGAHGFEWETPYMLPASARRVILIGQPAT